MSLGKQEREELLKDIEEFRKEELEYAKERISADIRTKKHDGKTLYNYILEDIRDWEDYKTYENFLLIQELGWLEEYLKESTEGITKYGLVTTEELFTDFTLYEILSMVLEYKYNQELVNILPEIFKEYLEEQAKLVGTDKLATTKTEYFIDSLLVVPVTELALETEREETEKFFQEQREKGKAFTRDDKSGILEELRDLGYNTSNWLVFEENVIPFVMNTLFPLTIGDIKSKIKEELPNLKRVESEKIGV